MSPCYTVLILLHFTITGTPQSLKNTRPIYVTSGRPFLGKSEKLRAAEHAALWELKGQYRGEPIDHKVQATFTIYVPDNRRRDLLNYCQFPADMLQKAGIIKDDSLIASLDGSRLLIDKEHPRTEIEVREFGE